MNEPMRNSDDNEAELSASLVACPDCGNMVPARNLELHRLRACPANGDVSGPRSRGATANLATTSNIHSANSRNDTGTENEASPSQRPRKTRRSSTNSTEDVIMRSSSSSLLSSSSEVEDITSDDNRSDSVSVGRSSNNGRIINLVDDSEVCSSAAMATATVDLTSSNGDEEEDRKLPARETNAISNISNIGNEGIINLMDEPEILSDANHGATAASARTTAASARTTAARARANTGSARVTATIARARAASARANTGSARVTATIARARAGSARAAYAERARARRVATASSTLASVEDVRADAAASARVTTVDLTSGNGDEEEDRKIPARDESTDTGANDNHQEEIDEWSCPRCTLRNRTTSFRCDACQYINIVIRRQLRPNSSTTRQSQSTIEAPFRQELSLADSSPLGLISSGALVGAAVGMAGNWMQGRSTLSGAVEGGTTGAIGGALLHEVLRDREREISTSQAAGTLEERHNHGTNAESTISAATIRQNDIAYRALVQDRQNRMSRFERYERRVVGASNPRMAVIRGNNIDSMSYDQLLNAFGNGTENMGASQREISRLPTHTVGDRPLPEDARQCLICLEDFERGDSRTILPCLHAFHKDCCRKWLSTNAKCPVCKHPISSNG